MQITASAGFRILLGLIPSETRPAVFIVIACGVNRHLSPSRPKRLLRLGDVPEGKLFSRRRQNIISQTFISLAEAEGGKAPEGRNDSGTLKCSWQARQRPGRGLFTTSASTGTAELSSLPSISASLWTAAGQGLEPATAEASQGAGLGCDILRNFASWLR